MDHRILLSVGSAPNQVQVTAIGPVVEGRPFFLVHIIHLGELRNEGIWQTALNPGEVGTVVNRTIDNLVEGETYCAYLSTSTDYSFSNFPDFSTVLASSYFRFNGGTLDFLPANTGDLIAGEQKARNLAPLFAIGGKGEAARSFEITVFFAGVDLHYASGLRGISIFPVRPGLSNGSVFDAVEQFLWERNTVKLPIGKERLQALQHQPMFALVLHEVRASDEEVAFRFATQTADEISIILGSERGDRPFPVLTFLLNRETTDWRLLPTRFDMRGNLLPPLFGSSSPELVESLLPIIKSRPFARLILNLYVEALAERNRSFRFFRQWSILEMIADRRVASDDTALLNLDGSEIRLQSGKALTTARKEGKVYKYLRTSKLPGIYQGIEGGGTMVLEGSDGALDQGLGVISLWEAVAAAYKLRNEVAHEGRFDFERSPADARDSLALQFFQGRFGFMEHAADYAMRREIYADQ